MPPPPKGDIMGRRVLERSSRGGSFRVLLAVKPNLQGGATPICPNRVWKRAPSPQQTDPKSGKEIPQSGR